jgi:two-component system chemotaxis sensor kinase CheA
LTPSELEKALAIQKEADGGRKIGSIVIEEHGVHPVVVAAALKKQETVARESHGSRGQHAIKIDVEKLDRLIDLVGELVIAGAGAKIAAI